ncbi:hypothetical protein [Planococcus chinensis]|uniref:Uncharacterized protein n=1 Tax=Planococcus chinensis TaxID=272917 RepID=A0ABW4QD87_9BACL
MKKTLIQLTAPALAAGLAFSGTGGALAAGPDAHANVKAQVKVEQSAKVNGADLSHRLLPIEKRISSVDFDVAALTAELEAKESLSYEEWVYYQEGLNALFGQVGASTNQLMAVTKKFGEDSAEVAEAKAEINEAFSTLVQVQALLDSIEVTVEEPEVETPEVPEAPEMPEAPAEETITL